MAIHQYSQIPIVDRRKFKADVLRLKDNLLKQKDKLYLLFLKPNDDKVKAIDNVIKNQISIEQFKHTLYKADKQKKEVFKMVKFE